MSTSSKPRNIVRIDIPKRNTHGWQVRVTRQRHRHTKFFSDSKFGGGDEALDAAKTFRDNLIDKLPEPLRGSEVAAQSRSTSGVPGIRLTIDRGNARIEADTLIPDGSRKVRTFSLKKWGLRKALWKACSWKMLASEGLSVQEASTRQDRIQNMYSTAYPEIRKQLEGAGMDMEELDHAEAQ